MVKFNATAMELDVMSAIAERALTMQAKWGHRRKPKMEWMLDLDACHSNGCKLDLLKLRDFPDFDFAHDMVGIANKLNRETGKLTDCFLPRCSAPSKKKAHA